jgi:hypothetical protein
MTPSLRRSVPIFWGLLISLTGGFPVPVWITLIFSLERASIAPPPFFVEKRVFIAHFDLM